MKNTHPNPIEVGNLDKESLNYFTEQFSRSGVPPYKASIHYAPDNSKMAYLGVDYMVQVMKALFSHTQLDIKQTKQYPDEVTGKLLPMPMDTMILYLSYGSGDSTMAYLSLADRKNAFSAH